VTGVAGPRDGLTIDDLGEIEILETEVRAH